MSKFFVISGFVITSSLLRRLQANERFGLIEFYGRRIRRLLPALAAMLVVVLGMSTWLSTIAARSQTIGTGLFATFSMANLYLYRIRPDGYFGQSEKANALIHTWSLSIDRGTILSSISAPDLDLHLGGKTNPSSPSHDIKVFVSRSGNRLPRPMHRGV